MTEELKELDGQSPEEKTPYSVPENNSDENPPVEKNEGEVVDYETLMKEDIAELKSEFSELYGVRDISELDNPLRYAALRDLGLTPKEAYLATRKTRREDNRSHLYSSAAIRASREGSIPESELNAARELFSDMSDGEIRKLYKKVTK